VSLTPNARELAARAADAAIAEVKAASRDKLRRVQQAVTPPLTNAELSAGLGVPDREVGRWVSEAPRLRRSRPGTEVRALLDALLAGDLFLAVLPTDERRQLLLCVEQDVPWLSSAFEVVNLGGVEVPARREVRSAGWDDDGMWDLFAATPSQEREPVAAEGRLCGRALPWLGLGCMRLSTDGRPDDEAGIARVRAALDAGVRLLDTADVYCLDEDDRGHNERLLRDALAGWDGPRDEVLVATKVGLVRPKGRWIPNARPAWLRKAVEGCLRDQGVDQLQLVQLHVADPQVPLADSLGELAAMQEEGLIAAVGACNLGPAELEEALRVVPLASLQVKANVFDAASFRNGVLSRAFALGVPLLAHSPLGGHRAVGRVSRDAVLQRVGEKHGVSPHVVALGWLMGMGLFPLVGVRRAESLDDSLKALRLVLDADDVAALDGRRDWMSDARRSLTVPSQEVVLISGSPAAGKTSSVAPLLARGYVRLNRDEEGGRIADLEPKLKAALEDGQRVVMDNTYATPKSRAGAVAVARAAGVAVRVIHLETSRADCNVNATWRLLERFGRLLDPEELKQAGKEHPNFFPPRAIGSYWDRLTPPDVSEGFASVERRGFWRRWPRRYQGRAVIFDYDGTLRESTGRVPWPTRADEVRIPEGRREVLDALVAAGWPLFGISNQGQISGGSMTVEQASAIFDHTNTLLGHDIPVSFCPHPYRGYQCWCRKPMPGFGVALIRQHELDPSRCWYVGDRKTDEQFAHACGFSFAWAEAFFENGWQALLADERAGGPSLPA